MRLVAFIDQFGQIPKELRHFSCLWNFSVRNLFPIFCESITPKLGHRFIYLHFNVLQNYSGVFCPKF